MVFAGKEAWEMIFMTLPGTCADWIKFTSLHRRTGEGFGKSIELPWRQTSLFMFYTSYGRIGQTLSYAEARHISPTVAYHDGLPISAE